MGKVKEHTKLNRKIEKDLMLTKLAYASRPPWHEHCAKIANSLMRKKIADASRLPCCEPCAALHP
jgi:hypothetical protein